MYSTLSAADQIFLLFYSHGEPSFFTLPPATRPNLLEPPLVPTRQNVGIVDDQIELRGSRQANQRNRRGLFDGIPVHATLGAVDAVQGPVVG